MKLHVLHNTALHYKLQTDCRTPCYAATPHYVRCTTNTLRYAALPYPTLLYTTLTTTTATLHFTTLRCTTLDYNYVRNSLISISFVWKNAAAQHWTICILQQKWKNMDIYDVRRPGQTNCVNIFYLKTRCSRSPQTRMLTRRTFLGPGIWTVLYMFPLYHTNAL